MPQHFLPDSPTKQNPPPDPPKPPQYHEWAIFRIMLYIFFFGTFATMVIPSSGNDNDASYHSRIIILVLTMGFLATSARR